MHVPQELVRVAGADAQLLAQDPGAILQVSARLAQEGGLRDPQQRQCSAVKHHLAIQQEEVPDDRGDVYGQTLGVERHKPLNEEHLRHQAHVLDQPRDGRQLRRAEPSEELRPALHSPRHQAVETKHGGRVQQVAKAYEGGVWRQVEQEHSREVAHALHVADVRPEEGVGLQNPRAVLMQRSALAEKRQRGEGPGQVKRNALRAPLLPMGLGRIGKGDENVGSRGCVAAPPRVERLLLVDLKQLRRDAKDVAYCHGPEQLAHSRGQALTPKSLHAPRRPGPGNKGRQQLPEPNLRVFLQPPLPLLLA
mmetsp:Transcript_71892/g.227146  ORF Transcript_71892/g.227146 Transcript_71892/m.227146 type:complete len:307 (+) Transcript_71892:316-1236(+)